MQRYLNVELDCIVQLALAGDICVMCVIWYLQVTSTDSSRTTCWDAMGDVIWTRKSSVRHGDWTPTLLVVGVPLPGGTEVSLDLPQLDPLSPTSNTCVVQRAIMRDTRRRLKHVTAVCCHVNVTLHCVIFDVTAPPSSSQRDFDHVAHASTLHIIISK